jgi:hypothetical protein
MLLSAPIPVYYCVGWYMVVCYSGPSGSVIGMCLTGVHLMETSTASREAGSLSSAEVART